MAVSRFSTRSPWRRAGYATTSKTSTSAPPDPRPFKPVAAEDRVSRHPEYPTLQTEAPVQKRGLFSRLWPFSSTKSTQSIYPPSQDPTRGIEAARRVVKEGFLDPRYKRAARSFTAVMCALPIAIYTSYELFQRRFRGKEQKARPAVPPVKEGEAEIGST